MRWSERRANGAGSKSRRSSALDGLSWPRRDGDLRILHEDDVLGAPIERHNRLRAKVLLAERRNLFDCQRGPNLEPLAHPHMNVEDRPGVNETLDAALYRIAVVARGLRELDPVAREHG